MDLRYTASTRTDKGIIYDVQVRRPYLNEANPGGWVSVGRIGRLDNPGPGDPKFYATPFRDPFDTGFCRIFHQRKEAAIWLVGIYDAQSGSFARAKADAEATARNLIV